MVLICTIVFAIRAFPYVFLEDEISKES